MAGRSHPSRSDAARPRHHRRPPLISRRRARPEPAPRRIEPSCPHLRLQRRGAAARRDAQCAPGDRPRRPHRHPHRHRLRRRRRRLLAACGAAPPGRQGSRPQSAAARARRHEGDADGPRGGCSGARPASRRRVLARGSRSCCRRSPRWCGIWGDQGHGRRPHAGGAGGARAAGRDRTARGVQCQPHRQGGSDLRARRGEDAGRQRRGVSGRRHEQGRRRVHDHRCDLARPPRG